MTLKEAAQDALAVQDAVNFSGVAHSLSKAVTAIWGEARIVGEGTSWVNHHPIVKMYMSKLMDLSGMNDQEGFSAAYTAVLAIADQDEVEVAQEVA